MNVLLEACDVPVRDGTFALQGELGLPSDATGVVVFSHGSGSGRLSPRNRYVAAALNNAGIGTLLIDLRSPREQAIDTRRTQERFDIRLLTQRLIDCVDWLGSRQSTWELAIGCFGASTGAAVALSAAAARPAGIRAIVSRGGRPELAGDLLGSVQAPTLLIVGTCDPKVLRLNELALAALRSTKELILVPGASHLFEEPGALEAVAGHARRWFHAHLGPDDAARNRRPGLVTTAAESM